MRNHSISRLLLTSLACVGIMTSAPANAGFEFTAPIATSSTNGGSGTLTPMESDPQLPPLGMEQQSPSVQPQPKIQWVDPTSQSMQPYKADVKSAEDKSETTTSGSSGIMSIAPQPLEPLKPINSTAAAKPALQKPTTPNQPLSQREFDMAVGFGENLPLVSALRQVIPPEFTYVLSKDVNAGRTVSWNGGQPWPTVLNDMLQPIGLGASLDGSVIKIRPRQSADQDMTYNMIKPMPQKAVTEKSELSAQDTNNMFLAAQQEMEEQNQSFDTLPPLPQKQIPAMPTPITAPGGGMRVETTEIPENEKDTIVPDEVTTGQWTAPQGSSLKLVLESWSDLQGVDLYWSSEFDYILAGDVNINGTYEDAVQTLLDGFSQAQPKPTGRLHPNLPNGPAVLVIESQQAMG